MYFTLVFSEHIYALSRLESDDFADPLECEERVLEMQMTVDAET
jgi:hypothetical protein